MRNWIRYFSYYEYVLNSCWWKFQLNDLVTSNGPSAYEHPSVIDEYLAKEVRLGRVFG